MEDGKKQQEYTYEFVQAVSPYEYYYKNQKISIVKGEIFLLLKRASEDWWQVIRKGEKRPFYAPQEYLELTQVEPSTMKTSLRRKMAHQRHLQNQQRQMEQSQSIPMSPSKTNMMEDDEENFLSKSTDPLLSAAEDSDGNTSFEYDKSEETHPKVKTKQRSASTDSQPDSSSSYGPTDLSNLSIQSQSSSSKDILSSSHTSASSLTDDLNSRSDESFSYFVLDSSGVMKAASTDGLRATEDPSSSSSYKGLHPKATSNEELDNQQRKKDLSFQSNLLSLRKRSNSVDMKECDTNLTLIEREKNVSLEKRKSRLSKDPMNRRRSWAMNDTACISTFQPIMDSITPGSPLEKLPPKLPPKVKNRINRLSLSIDNLKKIDVMEHSLEGETATQNTMPKLLEKPKSSSKKAPVALPRRTIPFSENNSLPKKLGDVAESPLEIQSMDRANKKNRSVENGSFHHRSSSLGPKTLDIDTSCNYKSDRTVGQTAKMYEKENLKSISKFREASNKVIELQREAPSKGKRVEELIEQIENKSKALKQCDMNKLVQQSPPSPTDSPVTILFDDWGKYLERESKMPFYYNTSTKEKRWKPPRRSAPLPQSKPLLDKSASPVPSPNVSPKVYEDRKRATITKSSKESPTQRNPLPKPKPPVVHMLSTNSYGRSRTDSYGSPSTKPRNPGNYALDTSQSAHAIVGCDPKGESNKSQWSLFSSISNSFSFMKSNGTGSSHVISKSNISVPTNLLSPSEKEAQHVPASSLQSESQLKSMQTVLEQFETPKGWVRKYDALSQQIYFQNVLTGEKWNPATDCSATLYFYPVNGGSSKWILPDYHAALDSLPDNGRSVTHGNLERERARIAKEENVMWCLYSKEGKKIRKNWTSGYVKYLPDGGKTSRGTPYGILIFSKSPDEQKKLETFAMVCPCYMLENTGGTTSRDNALALKNADGSIVIIQTKDERSSVLWKDLFKQNKIREIPHTPDKERKTKKLAEKPVRRDSAEESLNNNEKGLKDILLSFLKRRPMQETLVNKGIYKETVFGSTISELCSKDATYIPLFVLKCINAIERKGENFRMEGLYRIPGNAPRIQKIRFEIAQNRYTILEEEKDVHNLTGSLKLFFRELKEPLIPFKNYQSMIQSTGSEFLKGRTRSEALKDALKKLPRCNYDTLKILLEHLLKINMYEKVNRMSLMNLAIVFGPCLLWPESTVGFDLMTGVMLQNRVVEALLSDYKAIYKD